jgi:hypothetical protein
MIAFKNASNAIRRGKLTSYTTSDVCAFIKKIGAEKVFVISNLRNTPVSFSIPPAISATSWKDAFTGSKRALSSTIDPEPYSLYHTSELTIFIL